MWTEMFILLKEYSLAVFLKDHLAEYVYTISHLLETRSHYVALGGQELRESPCLSLSRLGLKVAPRNVYLLTQ